MPSTLAMTFCPMLALPMVFFPVPLDAAWPPLGRMAETFVAPPIGGLAIEAFALADALGPDDDMLAEWAAFSVFGAGPASQGPRHPRHNGPACQRRRRRSCQRRRRRSGSSSILLLCIYLLLLHEVTADRSPLCGKRSFSLFMLSI